MQQIEKPQNIGIAEPPPRVVIGSSNLNVSPRHALLSGVNYYEDFLDLGSFDLAGGYEWTALRFPAARRAGLALASQGLVTGLHESWREKTLKDILQLPSIREISDETQIALAFPLLDYSYKYLDRIQAAKSADSRLPIIVHPNDQYLGDQAPRRLRQSYPDGMFGERWFQPTVEWAARQNGVPTDSSDHDQTAALMVQAHLEQGIDGMALDTNHLLAERDGRHFVDPTGLIAALARQATMREIQLSLRPEFGGSMQVLRQICAGQIGQTIFGDMLIAANEAVPKEKTIRMVLEVQAGAIATATSASRNSRDGLEPKSHAQTLQLINESVRQLMKR